eukprot:TRINITY_DN2398_c0_g1_i1.p1 TRINITY_DN2398_c0_g1~~TRINITY_DN2398_c0_g1_i1.p1  ORF type:complete len:189 (-),score=63.70 TRINITY_DN2398_c0_g1_i1:53-619(-)
MKFNENFLFRFTKEEDVASQSLVKSSVSRGIRSTILENNPGIEDIIDDILPKKQQMHIAKCSNHITFITVDNEPLFFNERDGPYAPTLRLLHKYPNILPQVQVDRGAIKFVMGGANIMCPGLTSAGGKLPDDIPEGAIVAVMAEGKQHALGVGLMKMSSKDIKAQNKGIGIDNLHFLNDGLWKLPSLA